MTRARNKPLDYELPEDALRGTGAVFSRGILRTENLMQFLGASGLRFRPRSAHNIDFVVGWGHKPNTRPAKLFADEHNLPFIRLEDGFLRSTSPGRAQPSASMALDPLGIYYDASTPSRLEHLIASNATDPHSLQRAQRLATRIVASQLSKYNEAPLARRTLLDTLPEQFVLVVDQIANDASVVLSAGTRSLFEEMLQCAARENPGLPIVVKGHPAARSPRAGALQSAETRVHTGNNPLFVVREPINPHCLLKRATKVYVATSQMGFEALLHGKTVICFGQPFYAGWGLTEDRVSIPRRTARPSLAQLVTATLLDYCRYVHPVSGERCEIEDVLEHFELQRDRFGDNQGKTYCFGFWWWKRAHARKFLSTPDNQPVFCWGRSDALRQGFGPNSRALSWGMRAQAPVESLCRENGVSLERMEDGFIRSVGLGSDLTAPWSLVVDRRGIYYDPRQPSDLEVLLSQHVFSEKEIQRAHNLRQLLLASGISKYNPYPASMPPDTEQKVVQGQTGQRKHILVPGQVEQDASVLLGSPAVRTNLNLLKVVRTHHPAAHITFKPHPDVEAGNRPGRVLEEDALCYCDALVRDRPIAECLAQADELHTMTSLVGFEALLRGMPVEVYGQPFYSGWGLTKDHYPIARRTRRLSLDELVAGALLLYPRYVDPQTGYYCTAEQAVARISTQRSTQSGGQQTLLRLPLGRSAVHTFQFVRGMVTEALRV